MTQTKFHEWYKNAQAIAGRDIVIIAVVGKYNLVLGRHAEIVSAELKTELKVSDSAWADTHKVTWTEWRAKKSDGDVVCIAGYEVRFANWPKETFRDKQPGERNLRCACCGGAAWGKQWWNQETGFGLCATCSEFIEAKEGLEQLERSYGKKGVHHGHNEPAFELAFEEHITKRSKTKEGES